MCGILGIYGFNDKHRLNSAGRRLSHRGPDMHGHYSDKNIELLHKRLSIIDLSVKGKQPMSNSDGSLIIVFNGEIYNYLELKEKLKGKYKFNSDTDTEVILNLYSEYGPECCNMLDGDFAFAIWDSKKKELFFARDHTGVKPLYYSQFKGRFIFSSEYKAIIPFLDKLEVNADLLGDYLSWGFNPNNDSMIKSIKSLSPGHWMMIGKNKFVVKRYWSNKQNVKNKGRTYELIKSAVEKRLIGDVPLGVYLSGGLDSSAVVATLSEFSNNIKTFSVGFESQGVIDETIYAKKVSEMYGTDHREYHLDESSCKALPKVIWHLDEPVANLSAIPLFFLSKEAKKHATIILSGNGGDECFAGYRQHQWTYNAYRIGRLIPKRILNASGTIGSAFVNNEYNSRFFKNFVSNASDPKKAYSSLLFKDLNEEERSNILGRKTPAPSRLLELRNKDLLNDLKRIDLNYRAPNNYLLIDDKMSMANSIESRVPLFDKDLILHSMGLKPRKQVGYFDKKIILKKIMKGRLPRDVIHRKKYGFTSPLKSWFKNYLIGFKDLAYENGFFEKKELDSLFSSYMADNRKINVLWPIINFSLWHKIFIEQEAKFDRLK